MEQFVPGFLQLFFFIGTSYYFSCENLTFLSLNKKARLEIASGPNLTPYMSKYLQGCRQPLKIARPDLSQNFMNMAKTIDLTRLCIQINNTVFFFQSYTSNFLKNRLWPSVVMNINETCFLFMKYRRTLIRKASDRSYRVLQYARLVICFSEDRNTGRL